MKFNINTIIKYICPRGEIGRHKGFKTQPLQTLEVRRRPRLFIKTRTCLNILMQSVNLTYGH